jgi:hypothetical protein
LSKATAWGAKSIVGRFDFKDPHQRLAPIVDPAPKSSPLPGGVHVVRDGDARPAQAVLMTDAEAADWLTTTAAGEN